MRVDGDNVHQCFALCRFHGHLGRCRDLRQVSLPSRVSIPFAQLKAIRSLVNTPIVVYLAGVDRENGGIVGTPVLYGAWNVSPFRPWPASVAEAEDSRCPSP